MALGIGNGPAKTTGEELAMSLTADQARRLGGFVGIAFVVLAIVALFLPGTPPKADEASKIAAYFTDKRGTILASDYVTCAAFAVFLAFAGALRSYFGAADRTGIRPGSTMLAGGIAATSMVLAGTAVLNGAVFQVASAGDVNLNHALYDVANDLFFASAFGFAVFFAGAAVAIRLTGTLTSAMAPAAVVVAVLNLVGGVGFFADSGFFAIGGAFGFIGPLASLLWVLAASIVMLRRGETAPPLAARA
jgi:hypothetical protein